MEGSRLTACDACRLRKIRCDRGGPCSNCRLASRVCMVTGAGRRTKDDRPVGLTPLQHAIKLDSIEERLQNIEQLLTGRRGFDPSAPHPHPYSEGRLHTSQQPNGNLPTILSDQDLELAAEGPSSLFTQTRKMTTICLHANPAFLTNSEISDATLSLNQVLSDQAAEMSSEYRPLNLIHNYQVTKLPPTSAVVAVLKDLKGQFTTDFSMLRCFMSAQSFIDRCRNVVFCIDEYSPVDMVIVSSGLYYLFHERSHTTKDAVLRIEHRQYSEMCIGSLQTALTHLSASMPACIDSIHALVIGAAHAIEMAKPWFARRLACLAAQFCFTLGYNSEASMAREQEELRSAKALLFWHTYAIEKSLSLRLGRASTIRDCDITLPNNMEAYSIPQPWTKLISFWIAISRIQGETYELLYSPKAMSSNKSVLIDHADGLLSELRSVGLLTPHIFNPGTLDRCKALEDYLLLFDKLTYFTVATVICRAKSVHDAVSILSQECLMNARAALNAHKECMQATHDNIYARSLYIHWKLLGTPFIPFIIIFSAFMDSLDPADLGLMNAFVHSIESSLDLSTALHKLHLVCRGLFDVAKAVDGSTANTPQSDASLVFASEFSEYVKASGLPISHDASIISGPDSMLSQLEHWMLTCQESGNM